MASNNRNILFSSSGGLESNTCFTGLKSVFQQGCIHSGSSRGEFICCLFQHVEANCIPWLVAYSIFKASSHLSNITLLQLLLSCLCLSLKRRSVITLDPPRQSRIISSQKPKSHLQCPFCMEGNISTRN